VSNGTSVDVKEIKVKIDADKIISSAGKDLAAKIAAASPRKSGTYANGWTSEDKKTKGGLVSTVKNTGDNASLAHLLEYGHLLRAHGRVCGRIPPQPHIRPAYEAIKTAFVASMRDVGITISEKR
jgi:hypothetical protein